MDVHKDTITVAIAEGRCLGEVRQHGKISNDLHSLEKRLPKLGGENVGLHFTYEAEGTIGVQLPRVINRPRGIVRRRCPSTQGLLTTNAPSLH